VTAEPLLSVRDARREFGGVRAVDGVSFEVPAGTITGLIGPNGAGKSTLLNMIAGAIRPSSGSITFDGREIAGLPPYRIARLGLSRTFQTSSPFARMTVLENLLAAPYPQTGEGWPALVLGKRAWKAEEYRLLERARELLDRFDMTPKQNDYAGKLSGGQKRLVEIMRSLMTQPKLLLLDEPMAGVSPVLSRRIAGYLEELRARGLTMLMVEHELGFVDQLCDGVVVMAQGTVLSRGTMRELRGRREVVDAYLVG
jgi:ABC-type branched-subunit amino acid transport system ATPase component